MSKFGKATLFSVFLGIIYALVFGSMVNEVSPASYFLMGLIAGYIISYLGWFLLLIIGGGAVIGLVKDNHFKGKGPKCNNRYN
jgi:hypothetical protein|tara:strand:+ start:103 stop:351 length:249 start_codon:yes stop_codon:yes gene_type:complete